MIDMAYEPTTEAGKKAIAEGADPAVIEEQEADGSLVDEVVTKKPDEQHVENTAEELAAEAGGDTQAGKGEGGTGAQDPGPNRTPTAIPIWKHKEELKKLREEMESTNASQIEKAVADALAKKGGVTSEDVTKIAEEFNLTPENAQAFMDRIASAIETRLGLGDIRKDLGQVKDREQKAQEERGFEDEFSSQGTQDALKTILGDKPVTADVKKKLHELAYTTTYSRYRLSDIIRLNPTQFATEAPEPKPSAEGGRGGAGRGGAAPKSLEDLSPEQIEGMSDSEFLELSTNLAGGQSRFTRTTIPKKGRT